MTPIVLTDLFDPATLAPGVYQVTSDSVAYPLLRYMVISGFASVVWQQALAGGRMQLTAEVTPRQGGSFKAKPAKPRADVDLTRWSPDHDRKGQPVKPGDLVSVKTYPKGTARGRLVVSVRSWAVASDGSNIASLDVLTDDGVRYGSPSEGSILLLARGNPIEAPPEAAGGSGQMQFTRKWAEDNVMRDYADWREAWWRESIQNAVDAGATQVALTTTQEPDGSWMIACDDNGSGMSYEQIEDPANGFLAAFGGTSKGGYGRSTGAFGKAKELLVLPWIKYQVFNRDRRYIGSGNEWKWWPTTMRQGVRVEVIMPDDLRTDDVKAKAFLDKCWIPAVTFTINGHRYTTKLRVPTDPEDLVREHPMGMIYKIQRERSPEVYVRKNGIWMFSIPFQGKAIGESLLVEVTADSKTAFKQNRDEFALHSLNDTVRALVSEMTKQKILPRRALMEFRDYPTIGPDVAAARATRIQLTLGTLPEIGRDGARFDKKALDALRALLVEFQAEDYKNNVFLGTPDPDTAIEIMANTRITGQTSYDCACKQIVWPQTFGIHRFPGWTSIPKRFEPGNMTASIFRLARVWGEMVRYILMLLNTSREINVGWVLSRNEALALSATEKGMQFVMVNPFKQLDKGNEGQLLDPSVPADLRSMYASALHELTHAVDRVHEHDESFSSALTRNIEKAPLGMCDLRGLIKSLKAKLPDELKPEKPAGPKLPAGPSKQDMLAYVALCILRNRMDGWDWKPDEAAKALAVILARLDMKPRPDGWEYDPELQKRGAMMRAAAKQLKDTGHLVLDKGSLMYGGEYHRRSFADTKQFLFVSDGRKALRRWEAFEQSRTASRIAFREGTIKWEGFTGSLADLGDDDMKPLAGQMFDSEWDADVDPNAEKLYGAALQLRHTLSMFDGPFYSIRRRAGSSVGERKAAYVEAAQRLNLDARNLIGFLTMVEPMDLPTDPSRGVQLVETGQLTTSTLRFSRAYDSTESKEQYSLSTTMLPAKIIWDLTRRITGTYQYSEFRIEPARWVAEPTWKWETGSPHTDISSVADIIVAVEALTQFRKEYDQTSDVNKAAAAEKNMASTLLALESLSAVLFPAQIGVPTTYPDAQLASDMVEAFITLGVTELPSGHELSAMAEDYRTFAVTLYTDDRRTALLWERAGEAYQYGVMRRPFVGASANFYTITSESTMVAGDQP